MSVPLPHDDAPVRTGDVLAGKYRVERVLGVGGMGVVVAATQIELQRLVALKFVLPNKSNDTEAVERFLREARAAVKLKSEHVARVLDVGRLETGAPYMVMEFLEGMDLDAVLRRGPIAPEVAAEYIVQACEALAEAHSIGLVHRDLKPHNLFLTHGVGGRAVVKVLDFGISKILDQQQLQLSRDLTRTTSVLGSPFYMSPEQMRSARKVDQRSDIWSLGVILYELLTTHVPWEAETITQLALLVAQEPPTPIETYRNDVPDELRRVIDRCLQKDASARYANAGELATDLAPFASAQASLVAQRARSASQNTFPGGAFPAAAVDVGSGPASGPRGPRIGTSTHAATWGDTGPGTRDSGKSRVFPIVAALVVAAGVGIFFVARQGSPPSTTSNAPSVASAPGVGEGTTTSKTTATALPLETMMKPTSDPAPTAATTASVLDPTKKTTVKPWMKSAPMTSNGASGAGSAMPSASVAGSPSAAASKTSSPDDDIPTIR